MKMIVDCYLGSTTGSVNMQILYTGVYERPQSVHMKIIALWLYGIA
jgi:hypothetical protein